MWKEKCRRERECAIVIRLSGIRHQALLRKRGRDKAKEEVKRRRRRKRR